MIRWAAKWTQDNKLDGYKERILGNGLKTFRTRAECRAYIAKEFGYIVKRRDLQTEPHCWRVPKAVKIELKVIELKRQRFQGVIK